MRAYDIQAIVQALSADFALEEGTFNLFNISECKDTPACTGMETPLLFSYPSVLFFFYLLSLLLMVITVNNPESPYIWYNFSSWGGNFGHLREDEAIVAIQYPCIFFYHYPIFLFFLLYFYIYFCFDLRYSCSASLCLLWVYTIHHHSQHK